MSENLYFIKNRGCDDSTLGLARLSDEEFSKIKEVIENLNENSYYGCMPTISVYKAAEEDFKEVSPILSDDDCDKLYLDGKIYTFKDKDSFHYLKWERVI